jgi:hypothetical protein
MPLTSSKYSLVPLLLARCRRHSLPSLPLSDRRLHSLVPLPMTGCAIPQSSGEQGELQVVPEAGCIMVALSLSLPSHGKWIRHHSLSLPRGRWPPPPPSAMPTELDSGVVGSVREARFWAHRGYSGHSRSSPSESHDDASPAAPVLSYGELPQFPKPFGV